MIVLDTMVLSAFMDPALAPVVTTWLDSCDQDELRATAVSIYELRYGVDRLPAGKRRLGLERALVQARALFGLNGILPFDEAAAEAAGALTAAREARGIVVEVQDSMIAGIVMSRNATLATRNTRHFEDLPIPLINPWSDESND